MSTPPSRVEEIVRAALDLPSEERAAFLSDVCADDSELRRRVETWLRIRAPAPTPTPIPAPVRPKPVPKGSWLTSLLLLALVGASCLLGWLGIELGKERELSIQMADRLRRVAETKPVPPDDSARLGLDWLVTNLVGERGPLELVETRLDAFLKQHPSLTPPLREALGSAYFSRGDGKRGLVQFELAGAKAKIAEVQATDAKRADPANLTRLRSEIDAVQKSQPEKAEPLLRELVGILRDHGKDALDLAVQEVQLGRNLLGQGKHAEAETVLRDALARIEKTPPPAAWVEYDVRSLVGASLLGQKKYAEAEPFLVAGYEGLKEREGQLPETLRERVAEAGKRLAALREARKPN